MRQRNRELIRESRTLVWQIKELEKKADESQKKWTECAEVHERVTDFLQESISEAEQVENAAVVQLLYSFRSKICSAMRFQSTADTNAD